MRRTESHAAPPDHVQAADPARLRRAPAAAHILGGALVLGIAVLAALLIAPIAAWVRWRDRRSR